MSAENPAQNCQKRGGRRRSHQHHRYRSRRRGSSRHIGFYAPRLSNAEKRSAAVAAAPQPLGSESSGSRGGSRRFSNRRHFNMINQRPAPNDVRLTIEGFNPLPPPDIVSNDQQCNHKQSPPKGSDSICAHSVENSQPGTSKGDSACMETKTSASDDHITSPSARGNRRKSGKVRRAPKRKWKPYFKLTNEERRLLEIREERRAERVRAERFKKGQPVAPYNTTQFLFNDLQQRGGIGNGIDEPVNVDQIVENIRQNRNHKSSESIDPELMSVDNHSDDIGGSTSYAEIFNEKEFDYEYDAAFVERLSSMNKNDLIKDYLQLEKEYEQARLEAILKSEEIVELKKRIVSLEEAVSTQKSSAVKVVGDGKSSAVWLVQYLAHKVLRDITVLQK
uniref:Uncharacterized protein n=1 Tax=Romanomermis culicivorax TaxID=13658 RepID=A0A915L0Q1_ROMCU